MVLMLLTNIGTVKSDDFDLILWNVTCFFSMIPLLYVMDYLRGGKSSILIKYFIQFYFLRFGNIICNTFIHEALVVWSGLVYSLYMILVHINGRKWMTRLINIYIKHEDH